VDFRKYLHLNEMRSDERRGTRDALGEVVRSQRRVSHFKGDPMADKQIKDLSAKPVSSKGASDVKGGAKKGAVLKPRRRD